MHPALDEKIIALFSDRLVSCAKYRMLLADILCQSCLALFLLPHPVNFDIGVITKTMNLYHCKYA